MYFKENEYDQMVTRGRSDERVVGKVNLWTGALALILFLGAGNGCAALGFRDDRMGGFCRHSCRRTLYSGAVGPGNRS